MLEDIIPAIKYLLIFYIGYYLVLPLIRIFFNHFIAAKLFSGRKDLRKYGKWAVVTGATDGIGKAYAHELAKDGFNVLLISRTESKLKEEASAIEKIYGITTKTCAADFTSVSIYDEIKSAMADLEIGVLVNNVGMSYPHPIYLYDEDVLPDNLLMGMINCNAVSAVMMTRLVLPGMVTRGQGGAIINVASFSGHVPAPFLTVYSATKAFVDFLSRGVNLEVGDRHNIEVQSVLPLFVATKMSRMKPSFFSPSAKTYVRSALNIFGIESRTVGCFSHSLQAFFMSLLPECFLSHLMTNSLKTMMQKAVQRKLKSK